MMALPAMANTVIQGDRGTVAGEVSFEQRAAVMPMTMQPTSYWSVVVHDDQGVAYELAHVAGMDRNLPPKSIQVQGKVVHPGEKVVINGKIKKIRRDYGLLSEIEKINLVNE